MENNATARGVASVCSMLMQDHVRFVRIIGPSGSDLSFILQQVYRRPEIYVRSVLIEDMFFSSAQGLPGWFANALGLYEGTEPRPSTVPNHLAAFVFLRGISFLFIDDFHDVFLAPGGGVARITRDINLLLTKLPSLRIVVAEASDAVTPDYPELLEWRVHSVPSI